MGPRLAVASRAGVKMSASNEPVEVMGRTAGGGHGRSAAAGPGRGAAGAVSSSRLRVEMALAHVEADMVPLDLGGCPTTGIQASALYRLRQALGLDPPGTPVKITEPFQMLGEVGPDLVEALGIDVLGVGLAANFFGFKNEDWKPWTLFDGTPVLVPDKFSTVTSTDPQVGVLMYPEGDTSVPPSARMPAGGFYFDALKRQEPIDDDHLDPHDNLEEFGPSAARSSGTSPPKSTGSSRPARLCWAISGVPVSVTWPWCRQLTGSM